MKLPSFFSLFLFSSSLALLPTATSHAQGLDMKIEVGSGANDGADEYLSYNNGSGVTAGGSGGTTTYNPNTPAGQYFFTGSVGVPRGVNPYNGQASGADATMYGNLASGVLNFGLTETYNGGGTMHGAMSDVVTFHNPTSANQTAHVHWVLRGGINPNPIPAGDTSNPGGYVGASFSFSTGNGYAPASARGASGSFNITNNRREGAANTPSFQISSPGSLASNPQGFGGVLDMDVTVLPGDSDYAFDQDFSSYNDSNAGVSVVMSLDIEPSGGVTYTSASGVLLTAHKAFFNGETALSNGVYYLAFPDGNPFGYYSYLSDPHYIYHQDLGYEYLFDANDDANGLYLYDFKSGGFFYTSPTFPFPYLYDFSLGSTLYYYPDPNNPGRYNTDGVRYFYEFKTGQIISK